MNVRRLRPLALIAVTLVSAACFVAIEAGLVYAPPLLYAGLRLLIAGAVLFGVLLLRKLPLLPSRRTWPWLLILALTASTFAYGSMFLAPGFAGVGVASVLGNSQPLVAIVLAALFLDEPVTRRKGTALLLGLTGVALIAVSRPVAAGNSIMGPLLALASALGLTVGSVIVKRVGSGDDLLTLSAWQLSLGALPILATSLAVEPVTTIQWTPEFIGLLSFLALAGTAFVTVAWYALIRTDELGRLSLYFFLVPAFGLGLAVWLLGETLSPAQATGLLLVIAAVTVAASSPATRGCVSPPGRRSFTLPVGTGFSTGEGTGTGVSDPAVGTEPGARS